MTLDSARDQYQHVDTSLDQTNQEDGEEWEEGRVLMQSAYISFVDFIYVARLCLSKVLTHNINFFSPCRYR